jgi:hypothetical protein
MTIPSISISGHQWKIFYIYLEAADDEDAEERA